MNSISNKNKNNNDILSSIVASFARICLRLVKSSAVVSSAQSSRRNNRTNCIDEAHNAKTESACRKYYDNNSDVAKLEWINLLNRSVFLVDNTELGRIEAVNHDSIVIKTGSLRAKRYYITKDMLKRRKNNNNNNKASSSTTTTASNDRSNHLKDNNNTLFLDLVYDEVTLYESTKIPNPNAFATLGTYSWNIIQICAFIALQMERAVTNRIDKRSEYRRMEKKSLDGSSCTSTSNRDRASV